MQFGITGSAQIECFGKSRIERDGAIQHLNGIRMVTGFAVLNCRTNKSLCLLLLIRAAGHCDRCDGDQNTHRDMDGICHWRIAGCDVHAST